MYIYVYIYICIYMCICIIAIVIFYYACTSILSSNIVAISYTDMCARVCAVFTCACIFLYCVYTYICQSFVLSPFSPLLALSLLREHTGKGRGGRSTRESRESNYAFTYIQTHTYIYIYIHTCTYIPLYAYVYVCTSMPMRMYTYDMRTKMNQGLACAAQDIHTVQPCLPSHYLKGGGVL